MHTYITLPLNVYLKVKNVKYMYTYIYLQDFIYQSNQYVLIIIYWSNQGPVTTCMIHYQLGFSFLLNFGALDDTNWYTTWYTGAILVQLIIKTSKGP